MVLPQTTKGKRVNKLEKLVEENNLVIQQWFKGECAIPWKHQVSIDAAQGYEIWYEGHPAFISLEGDNIADLVQLLKEDLRYHAILPYGQRPGGEGDGNKTLDNL